MNDDTLIKELIADARRVNSEDAFDGDHGERFSAILNQTYLVDVILIDSAKLPEERVVMDIHHREFSYNIHDDYSSSKHKTHLGTYAMNSLEDAIKTISAVALKYACHAI